MIFKSHLKSVLLLLLFIILLCKSIDSLIHRILPFFNRGHTVQKCIVLRHLSESQDEAANGQEANGDEPTAAKRPCKGFSVNLSLIYIFLFSSL